MQHAAEAPANAARGIIILLAKKMIRILAAVFISLCMSCGRNSGNASGFDANLKAGEYLHMHTKGGWGFDGDYWIFPDDSFRVRYFKVSDGSIVEDRVGSSSGVFQRIVAMTDSVDGWRITSDSLQKDLEAARKGKGMLGVMDSDHAHLTFNLPDKKLEAVFYASASIAEYYRSAKEVSAFARLEAAIRDETKER
jgi:hypothetical protein